MGKLGIFGTNLWGFSFKFLQEDQDKLESSTDLCFPPLIRERENAISTLGNSLNESVS